MLKRGKGNTHESSVIKAFLYSLIGVQSFFIILALPYAGEKAFFGFGSFGGFLITLFLSFFIAFLAAVMVGASIRGEQIGNIIDEKDPQKDSQNNQSDQSSDDMVEKHIKSLKERFAKGEITAEEFKEKKKILEE